METDKNRGGAVLRDEKGLFLPGTAPGPGLPPETEEQRIVKKAIKEIVKEYKEGLAEALPQISPVLIGKAMSGDVPAIKELHDRVMDKAPIKKELSGPDGGPIKSNITITFKDGSPISE